MLFAYLSVCVFCLVHSGVAYFVEEHAKPKCGYNEVAVPCKQICPPQNCDIAYTDYACTEELKKCEPGCDCLPDHLRNGSGICIPNDQCPPPPCQIPDECKRTCAEPNPTNCVYNPPKYNMDGCDCKEGYILSYMGGDCIPIDECPPSLACHGDPNGRPKRCPKTCPSTCEAPDQNPCKILCQPIACECKDNYILSNNTEYGRCILPDNCPGGNPCGKGSHFVDCKRECQRDYCPIDDRRDQSCDPPEDDDCLSGCICDLNHKRKSLKNPRCIVSSKCPPVNCTRPNEKWSSCPSACLAENCEDVKNQPTVCNTLVLNCEPRCICRKNHFRNASGICIPAKDCPPVCKDPKAVYKECTSACEPTCANPRPEICTAECRPARCVCKEGYVLNEDIGICVLPSECPAPVCKDPKAVYKECTSACEPTCANPRPEICTAECRPARCVCKEGYVLNEDIGICVLPSECPAPVCKDPKAVYKKCTSACEPTCANPWPEICTAECRPARCVCKEGYVLNEDIGICVLPSECPAPVCKDPKAVYKKCTSACEPTCANPWPEICTAECRPARCVCKEGYVLNEDIGICVLPSECPAPVCKDPKAVYKECTSACEPTCANPRPEICTAECRPARCVCKEGYVLNEDIGICVLPSECPAPVCKDPKAVYKECTSACEPTCANPRPEICTAECRPARCVCKEGYVLNEDIGICVLPSECPAPVCKDPKAVYKECTSACEPTCANPRPEICTAECRPARCVCKEGYVLNKKTGICVLQCECPDY